MRKARETTDGGDQRCGDGRARPGSVPISASDRISSSRRATSRTGRRFVLFQRGRCHGRPAYNAIEWYYPRHGERFSPGNYINACTGRYYTNGHPDS